MAITTSRRRLRVAIIGGGIAGLTLAIALAKLAPHLEIDIYESTSDFRSVGAGIGMWPRVWDALKELGLFESLNACVDISCTDERFHYRKSDQSEGVPFGTSELPLRSVHRADFLEVLTNNFPPSLRAHFSKRLVKYVDTDGQPVTLHFKDGSTRTCDVLVGADGIKSSVREVMYHGLASTATKRDPERTEFFSKYQHPTWTGQIAYRCLLPRQELEGRYPDHASLLTPCIYSGKNKYIVTYPVSQGKMINIVALISYPEMHGTTYDGPWSCPATTNELLDHFGGWEASVVGLLQMLKTPSRWVINSVESLPTYISGRVALLGDAAHAMTPHQASGAGQGIEDALVLASLLSLPEISPKTLPLALKVYDEIRRPPSQEVLRRSLDTGSLYFMQNGKMGEVSKEESATAQFPIEALEEQAKDLRTIFRWTCTSDIPHTKNLAGEMFKQRLRHT